MLIWSKYITSHAKKLHYAVMGVARLGISLIQHRMSFFDILTTLKYQLIVTYPIHRAFKPTAQIN